MLSDEWANYPREQWGKVRQIRGVAGNGGGGDKSVWRATQSRAVRLEWGHGRDR